MALLKRALSCRSREAKKNEMMIKTLRLRAWFCYTLATTYRLVQIITKAGAWYEEVEPCSPEIYDKCLGTYRSDLLDLL